MVDGEFVGVSVVGDVTGESTDDTGLSTDFGMAAGASWLVLESVVEPLVPVDSLQPTRTRLVAQSVAPRTRVTVFMV